MKGFEIPNEKDALYSCSCRSCRFPSFPLWRLSRLAEKRGKMDKNVIC